MSDSSRADDPIARDIEERNPNTDDVVAGEQVLADDPADAEPKVAPEPDELADASASRSTTESASASVNGSTSSAGSAGGEDAAGEIEETDRDRAERHY